MKTTKFNGYDATKLRVRRFIALFIDWYLASALAAIPITFYYRGTNPITPSDFKLASYPLDSAIFICLFAITIRIIYFCVVPLFVFKGQTLGKKIMKIKIVQTNLKNVTFKNIFLREIIGSTLVEGGIIIMATHIRQLIQLFFPINILQVWSTVALIITFISIIYAYIKTETRMFHDLIGDTIIIKC